MTQSRRVHRRSVQTLTKSLNSEDMALYELGARVLYIT